MSADHDRAQDLQAKLGAHVTRLGQLITEPASRRDIPAVIAEWEAVDRLNAPLRSVYRKLRKSLHNQGKTLQNRELREAVKALERMIFLWEEIEQIVGRHISLPEADLALEQGRGVFDPLLSHIHTALHILANPNEQDTDAREENCFADIAMDIQSFEQLIVAAYRLLLVQGRTENARFLDVGCGGGTKVFAAARLFGKCDGLEYDPGYARAGRKTLKLLMPGRGKVITGNALEFEKYGDYDVIYFYRPINNHDLLLEMQTRIVAQARPGTILIAPYNRELEPRKPYPCARIKGCIFVTGVTQEEADIWHADARRTDTVRIRRPRDLRHDPGVWGPVLEAASYNGSEHLNRKLLPEERAYLAFSAAKT